MQLAAYRIVQEAFTNSLRYAGSSTDIRLWVRVDEDTITITVHDTGHRTVHTGHRRQHTRDTV